MSTKTTNILGEMRQALINSHNNNNAKAISKDFAAGSGVSERTFNSWVTWCETLHYHLAPWAEKYNDGAIPDEDLNKFLDDAMPILRQMSKVDSKLFVRANDATFLVGKVHEFGKSANGTLDVVKGKVAFRRQIEAMFGCRIAGNSAISEDDYEVVIKYEKAKTNIDKATDRLEGYVNVKGESIIGLKDRLEDAKKILGDMKKALGITEEIEKKLKKENKELVDEYPLLTAYITNVNDLEDSVKSTNGQITKCKETKKKYEKKYKELMDSHPEIKTK